MMKYSILVIRFSSMGDVAMLSPVLRHLLEQHPEASITLVTPKFFHPFFENIPQLQCLDFDKKGKHRGFLGLLTLARELSAHNFTHFADLHDVLRSKILCVLLYFSIKKIQVIDKERAAKRKLTQKHNKVFAPLQFNAQRYALVFDHLGFPITLSFSPNLNLKKSLSNFGDLIPFDLSKKHIGIAPFSKHKGKIYPLEKTERIVHHFSSFHHHQLYLFGGPEDDIILSQWAAKYPHTTNLVQKLNLSQELGLIKELDVIFTMDSANMHMANLMHTPVVSFWGATHPYAGFIDATQKSDSFIQRKDLSCRPCSVYGKTTCWRKDWACLAVDEQLIITRLEQCLDCT